MDILAPVPKTPSKPVPFPTRKSNSQPENPREPSKNSPSFRKPPPLLSLLHRPFPPRLFPYPYIHCLILLVNVLPDY
jgi:hypothetical protein